MKRIELLLAGAITMFLMNGLAVAQDTTLTVTSGGTVGIGTTMPQATLDVSGNALIRAGTSTGNAAGASGGLEVRGEPGTYEPSVALDNGTQQWNIVSWSDNSLGFVKVSGTTFTPFRINNTSFQDALVLASSGVGIGTASPFSRLHVHSEGVSTQDLSTASTTDPVFQRFFHSGNLQGGAIGYDTDESVLKLVHGGNFNTSTNGMTISSDGYVGIGAIPSEERMELNGNLQFSPGGRRTIKFLDPLRSLFIGANPAGQERGPHAIHLVTDDGMGSTPRVSIVGDNGYVGIGKASPNFPLEMGSGAHVTSGGVWVDASSRQFKENIAALALEDAVAALAGLHPVTFSYTSEKEEDYVGFIAEDVPDLVATGDRKSLSPMDIVAVLTKVVQHQQHRIAELEARLDGGH